MSDKPIEYIFSVRSRLGTYTNPIVKLNTKGLNDYFDKVIANGGKVVGYRKTLTSD